MKFEDIIINIEHSEVKKNDTYCNLFNASKSYLVDASMAWAIEFLKINKICIGIGEWKSILSLFVDKANKASFFPLSEQDLESIIEHVFIYTWFEKSEKTLHH